MHKLTRPDGPSCLKSYRHGANTWRDVTQAQKTEIWLKLDEMQNKRCAYCECAIKTSLGDSNSHIEHFRQRARYPQGTFLWSNLFGSCNNSDRCGTHKDNLPPYNPEDVIKPDEEDPEDFLLFLDDGSVIARQNLNAVDKQRAEETIRIFNLDRPLRQIRETHVKGYKKTAEELAEMAANFDEDEWLPLLEAELAAIADLPFSTAIKHILLAGWE